MRRCELGRSVLLPSATDHPSTKVSRRAIQPAPVGMAEDATETRMILCESMSAAT